MRFEDELRKKGNEPLRPGFVRLSLPFFASVAEVDYCVAAIKQVRVRIRISFVRFKLCVARAPITSRPLRFTM